MNSIPKLTGIDHIHIYVSDRTAAGEWYREKLGFSVVDELKIWADEHGPLTLQDATGKIHLALFQRESFTASTALAMAADGENFLAWKTHLEAHGLLMRCADHRVSWSLYFKDPDDNLHEITTYQYDYVSGHLKTMAA